MNGYAPLFSTIVDSSIWDEDDSICKVFVTMMALKDADHIVRLTAYQIGRRCRKPEREVLDALLVLSSPDKKRVEPQEYDGRRIQKVDAGWLVLNGEKYKQLAKDEARKSRNRRSVAAWRLRQKLGLPQKNGMLPTEPVNGERGVL